MGCVLFLTHYAAEVLVNMGASAEISENFCFYLIRACDKINIVRELKEKSPKTIGALHKLVYQNYVIWRIDTKIVQHIELTDDEEVSENLEKERENFYKSQTYKQSWWFMNN